MCCKHHTARTSFFFWGGTQVNPPFSDAQWPCGKKRKDTLLQLVHFEWAPFRAESTAPLGFHQGKPPIRPLSGGGLSSPSPLSPAFCAASRQESPARPLQRSSSSYQQKSVREIRSLGQGSTFCLFGFHLGGKSTTFGGTN